MLSRRGLIPSLLIALLTVEAIFIFYPEPILLFWPDSISYAGPAADALESGRLTNWNTASGGFVYPLVVWGMLRIAPEPWTIVFVQRFMVLATFACLLLVFWALWRDANRARRLPLPLGAAVMAFWLLVYILFPPVIGLGQSLMPEALFSFVLALVLAGLVAIALPSVPSAIGTGAVWTTPFLSVTLAFVKPHWVLAAAVVPGLMPWLVPRAERRRLILPTAISLALAIAVVVLPEGVWQEREGARFNRVFGPRSLFCNSADVVHAYLERRVEDPLAQDVDRALKPLLTPEARAHARVLDWNLLDFEGDKCTHGAAAAVIQEHFRGELGAEVWYYFSTYAKAVTASPAYLPTRLARQLAAVARRPFNGVQTAVFLTSNYFPALESARDRRQLFARWFEQYGRRFRRPIVLPTREWQASLRVLFTFAGLALSGTTLVALLWIGGRWRARAIDGLDRALLAIVICALALNGLIAVVHTFDLPRYSAMQTPLFSLLGYMASLTLLAAWSDRYTFSMFRRSSRPLTTSSA